jgi:hypothetical protein
LTLVLAVGIVNYLPTRWGWSTVAVSLWFAAELCALVWPRTDGLFVGPADFGTGLAVGLVVVLLWRAALRHRRGTELDKSWLDFRDCYGFVWGRRVEEQINNAAQNSGRTTRLTWKGFVPPPDAEQLVQVRETLQAALKRFVAPQ